MKIKLFFSILLMSITISSVKAQYVNNVAISDLDADYVMIWSDSGPLLSSKITVRLDYGQGGRISQIQDDRRKVITFNGMLAAINMMSRSGFELDRIYRDPKGENDYYYFKRRGLSSSSLNYSSEGSVEYDPATHIK